MIFEESKVYARWGERLGFVAAYFVFTTVLFFMLWLLKRLPPSYPVINVMISTALIILVGVVVKRLLR
jgi:hypothetical protein